MKKLFCANCKTWMNPNKTGRTVLETDDDGKPYKLWSGDEYKCPRCKFCAVAGFGITPLAAEGYDEDFDAITKSYEDENNLIREIIKNKNKVNKKSESSNCEYEDSIKALEAELKLAKKFHDLVIKERDYERMKSRDLEIKIKQIITTIKGD